MGTRFVVVALNEARKKCVRFFRHAHLHVYSVHVLAPAIWSEVMEDGADGRGIQRRKRQAYILKKFSASRKQMKQTKAVCVEIFGALSMCA